MKKLNDEVEWMYIHLGEKHLVKQTDIIAIIDKEAASFSTNMENFWRQI